MNRNTPIIDLEPGDVMLDDTYSADGMTRAGNVEALQSYRAKFHREAASILRKVRSEGRDISEAEERRVDELFGLVEAVDSRMEKARESRDRRNRDSARYTTEPDRGTTSREWLAWTNGQNATVDIRLNPLVEWTTARSRDRKAELRDYLTTNVDTVPRIVWQEILMRLVETSGVLSAGPRTITTREGSGDIRVPVLTQYGTATIVAEGSAIGESDSTFDSVDMSAYKYGLLSSVSNELLFDSAFDLAPWLGADLGTKIGRAVSAHLTTGSGTAQPEGIVTSATVGVTGTATSPTIANIFTLWSSLPHQYRANASWVLNPSVYASLVAQNDTQGRSLVLGDLSSAQPMMMFGAPVFLDSTMPAAGTANRCVWVGDMSRYLTVRYAGDLRVESSDQYKFSEDRTVWRGLLRVDAKVTEQDAARVFVGG